MATHIPIIPSCAAWRGECAPKYAEPWRRLDLLVPGREQTPPLVRGHKNHGAQVKKAKKQNGRHARRGRMERCERAERNWARPLGLACAPVSGSCVRAACDPPHRLPCRVFVKKKSLVWRQAFQSWRSSRCIGTSVLFVFYLCQIARREVRGGWRHGGKASKTDFPVFSPFPKSCLCSYYVALRWQQRRQWMLIPHNFCLNLLAIDSSSSSLSVCIIVSLNT